MEEREIRLYDELFRNAKKSAGKRKIAWELTKEEFDKVVRRAGGHCEVTGVSLSFRYVRGGGRRPWAPSLDRRNSRLGYKLSNVRIVCVAANYAMNEWGIGVLKRLADSMSGKEVTYELLAELSSPRDIKIRSGAKSRRVYRVIEEELPQLVEGVDYFSTPCRCLLFSEHAAARLVGLCAEKGE